LGLMESCECLGVHGASVWGGGRSSNLAGGSCRDGVHRGFTFKLALDGDKEMLKHLGKEVLGQGNGDQKDDDGKEKPQFWLPVFKKIGEKPGEVGNEKGEKA